MAVEILILSGARAGERLVFDATEFRAGGEPQCELFFDPRRDATVEGQSAKFRLMDDGWYVKCEGRGPVLINQRPMSELVRVRSGDVLQMSEQGPDFSFSIVSHAAATAANPSVQVQAPWQPPPPQPAPVSVAAAAPTECPMPKSFSAVVPITSPTETGVSAPEPATAAAPPSRGITLGRRSLWIGGGVVLFALLLLIVPWLRPSPPLPKVDRLELIRTVEREREDRKKKQEETEYRKRVPVPQEKVPGSVAQPKRD